MFTEAVRKGAALLDQRFPRWRDKVDSSTLDMQNNCVLKQVFGNYREGMYLIGLAHKWADGCMQFEGYTVSEYGFTIMTDGDINKKIWTQLTDEWRKVLLA
jgi:hypothetical protein